jgi:hypothetical protein
MYEGPNDPAILGEMKSTRRLLGTSGNSETVKRYQTWEGQERIGDRPSYNSPLCCDA